jgi:hypothetical protein
MGHNGKYKTRCWLYEGCLNPAGYGVTNLGGREDGEALVHRLVYEELVGPIPAGLTLDHLCRVRNCVRPNHLEPVTQAENVRRAMRRDGFCKKGLHPLVSGKCKPCFNAYMREYNARKKKESA